MVSPPHIDHEKLDVYQFELKFLSWVAGFFSNTTRLVPPRASKSAVINTQGPPPIIATDTVEFMTNDRWLAFSVVGLLP